ncbi:uncharacterized protein A1O5_01520 [Cladophialophora psammophila CBS 110553]|uniref:Carbohydrate kinase PfkB domain-containing protein n=1 Tax=Cladophialophora psammophila CBS 110553 TaxID=1182543 RepID=W9XX39_9EURO|nr:uncharacterized protein A1O5_01520 [Cladophialophora psammophila CBS 110553]EXJ74824.1 hypothetical protein A1O5_01520 [Cladophialophora psammophila CBS 110553]
MFGAVGTDRAGIKIVKALKEDKVDTEHIIECPDEETRRTSIALGKSGKNNILVYPGAKYKLTPAQLRTDLSGGPPHLLILQMEIPFETVEHVYTPLRRPQRGRSRCCSMRLRFHLIFRGTSYSQQARG